MFGALIMILEQLAMAALPALFHTLAKTVQKVGLDGAALDALSQYVNSADKNPLLTTSSAKWDWVYAQFRQYLSDNAITIADSAVNALIELTVHNAHANAPAAVSAPTPVAASTPPPTK